MAKKTKWKVPASRPKEGSSNLRFVRPSQLAEEDFKGVLLEGRFVESMPNPFDNEKLDFKFSDNEDKTVIINGAGNLTYKMKGIEPGAMVQVSYNGKKEISKGNYKGRMAHDFEVMEEDIEE